jgi:hypothetical protein
MSTDIERLASKWSGWVIFAGVVLFTVGWLNIIQGIAALARDTETFALPEANLLVTTDYTAWGWSMIIWGAIMILTAGGLFTGKELARWIAIAIVVVNLIGQFGFFPAFPLWSLVVIGLDLAVLFALTARWEYAKAVLK